MQQTKLRTDYPPEGLPLRKARDELAIYKNKFLGLIKKHSKGKVIRLSDEDLASDIEMLVKSIHTSGFDLGLAQMDKMHGLTELDNQDNNFSNG